MLRYDLVLFSGPILSLIRAPCQFHSSQFGTASALIESLLSTDSFHISIFIPFYISITIEAFLVVSQNFLHDVGRSSQFLVSSSTLLPLRCYNRLKPVDAQNITNFLSRKYNWHENSI